MNSLERLTHDEITISICIYSISILIVLISRVCRYGKDLKYENICLIDLE